MLDGSSHLPEWLLALLTEKFFNACIDHEDSKKNEKNIFCLDCCEAICQHCVHPHRLLQVRRYVYHDVIKLGDAQKLMDCDYVQSYTNNGAKVVFLKSRPFSKTCRSSGNPCLNCDRVLQNPYLYCSISCKLQHLLRSGSQLAKYIHSYDRRTMLEWDLEDGLMTPNTVLEPAGSVKTDSGGSGSPSGVVDCRTFCCTATTEVVRKKRSNLLSFRSSELRRSFCPVMEIAGAVNNRRKGVPQRSPLT
ncbi:unnamed protein product [Cuscuta epithymum]|uniref:B box-type domain-containing protein n=2 Tax=Cuscuta epithymum TaxID=186058 RepID=A0AAV0GM37_9ASTE|nr:unnamed protein product [Cuscuta epithymum]CAH9148230.1 unnamed protein product [Cuscuta epithymum]